MVSRDPMSAGTKRTALKVITLILLGLGIALVVRGLAERVESGAGLARLNSSERCDAAPGCNQAMVRVVYPGAGVIVLASWTAKRIGWRPFWARGRPGAVGGVKHLIGHRSTLTLHRSTRDGPVRERTLTTSRGIGDPLTPAETDELLTRLEGSDTRIALRGSMSEDDARRR